MADPGVQLRRRIALYSFAFLALGVSMALPGAALLPLQESADAKLRDMGAIFSFRAVGYLSSSVLGGLLSDRCARRGHGIMAVGVLANSLALAAVAVGAARRGGLVALGAALVGSGVGMGVLDTAGNVTLLRACAEAELRSGPRMMIAHACFGAGAFLAPLTLRACENRLDISFTLAASFSTIVALALVACPSPAVASADAAPATADAARSSSNAPRTPPPAGAEASEAGPRLKRGCCELCAIASACLLLCVYVGLEVSFGAVIAALVEARSLWRRAKALSLNAGYWASLTVGRLFAAALASRLTPGQVLAGAALGAGLACVALLGLAAGDERDDDDDAAWAWWAATLALGACFGPIFPGALTLLEEFVAMTGRVTAACVVGAGVGELTLGAVLVAIYGAGGASEFAAAMLGCAGVQAALVMGLIACGARTTKKLAARQGSGFARLPVGDDSEAGIVMTATPSAAKRQPTPVTAPAPETPGTSGAGIEMDDWLAEHELTRYRSAILVHAAEVRARGLRSSRARARALSVVTRAQIPFPGGRPPGILAVGPRKVHSAQRRAAARRAPAHSRTGGGGRARGRLQAIPILNRVVEFISDPAPIALSVQPARRRTAGVARGIAPPAKPVVRAIAQGGAPRCGKAAHSRGTPMGIVENVVAGAER